MWRNIQVLGFIVMVAGVSIEIWPEGWLMLAQVVQTEIDKASPERRISLLGLLISLGGIILFVTAGIRARGADHLPSFRN